LRRAALAAVAALAGLGAVAPADAGPAPRTYYVSFGDSLAQGWQPDSSGRSRATKHGYVDTVAHYLGGIESNLASVKFGCGGENTTTMMRGGTCSYSAGSQLAEGVRFLHSHRGRIAAVTLNIGDNDVESCLRRGSVNTGCVNQRMAGLRARLPKIVARLRAAAGKQVPIVGMTDYDQFLAYWLRGSSGRQFARQSVAVVQNLNQTVDSIYSRAGVRPADALPAFAPTDFTDRDRVNGHGTLPRAVARICAWTWACSRPPIGFNDHANNTGYRLLGRVVINALRS
jgi:lysophospholipase L1-like esterase